LQGLVQVDLRRRHRISSTSDHNTPRSNSSKQNYSLIIHCVSKIRTDFETVQLQIVRIDFDEIWQKYSKYCRIEFVCFSSHVCLLVITLSSLKLHTVPKITRACIISHLPLPGRLSTVPNFLKFTSSLLMQFFVQPLSGNLVINCQVL